MTKKFNPLPSERVDIPDFDAATSGLSTGLQKQEVSSFIADRASMIAEGFRAEIADQGASPGLFTIFNGVGYDRNGQIIENEDAFNTSRSKTIVANATYYVEIQFTEGASDVDARGFWDPDHNNGSDPSGDARPSGREFSRNVATRISPDWEIVSPISTTGFEVDTLPNSTKIPVCILVQAGGVISGGTTVPLQTIIAEDILAAATSIKLLDTRAMKDSFILSIDVTGVKAQEDVTIIANDRANHILSIGGGGTVNAHSAGIRVEVAGGTPEQFLVEDSTPGFGVVTADERVRFFQGDEERGRLISLDPAGFDDDQRSDLEIKNLKRHVDFLAAQLRELKFGGQSIETLGKAAPVTPFSAVPRYYENAGGVLAARGHHVSVGDGINTWGDFNLNAFATPLDALNAALAKVQLGGTIYLKAGIYDLPAVWTLNVAGLTVIGDGPSNTIINATGVTAAIDIASDNIIMRDLAIAFNGGTASHALTITDSTNGHMENLVVEGVDTTVDHSDYLWSNCKFTGTIGEIVFKGTASTRVRFYGCNFTTDTSLLSGCANFTTGSFIQLRDCDLIRAVGSTTGPTLVFDGTTDIVVSGCRINVPRDDVGINFNNINSRLKVTDCDITQVSNDNADTGIGIRLEDASQTHIRGCAISSCNIGIAYTDVSKTIISENIFDGNSIGRVGIGRDPTGGDVSLLRTQITDNQFLQLDGDGGSNFNVAIDLGVLGATNLAELRVSGNIIRGIDLIGISTLDCYGIALSPTLTFADIQICNNIIEDIASETLSAGIIGEGEYKDITISNNTITGIGNTLSGNPASATFWAIRINSGTNVRVHDNQFTSLGNVLHTGVGAAGISVGTSSTQSYQVSICGNAFNGGVDHGVLFKAIAVRGVRGICVNGNNIDDPAVVDVGYAIFFNSADSDVGENREITICNNTIDGRWERAIWCDLDQSTDLAEGRMVVSNNVISRFNDRAIIVNGDTVNDDRTAYIIVSNNIIHSDSADVTEAIQINSVKFAIVMGNIVRLTTTDTLISRECIEVLDVIECVITGNICETVATAGQNSAAIMVGGGLPAAEGTIVGNYVLVQDGRCITPESAMLTGHNRVETADLVDRAIEKRGFFTGLTNVTVVGLPTTMESVDSNSILTPVDTNSPTDNLAGHGGAP